MFGSIKDVMTQPLNDVVDDLRNEFIKKVFGLLFHRVSAGMQKNGLMFLFGIGHLLLERSDAVIRIRKSFKN